MIDAQRSKINEDIALSGSQRSKIAKEIELYGTTKDKTIQDTLLVEKQITRTTEELSILRQRKLTEEAQSRDVVYGETVTGILGKQRQVYKAQADGFSRDA